MKKNKQLKKLVEKCCKFCCPGGKLDEQRVLGIIQNLKSLPRSQALFAISEFLKALKKQKSQTTLVIESSMQLSKAQVEGVVRKLKSDFQISEVKNIINPDLLAGFRVRIADSVADYSLQGRILQLKEAVVT